MGVDGRYCGLGLDRLEYWRHGLDESMDGMDCCKSILHFPATDIVS